MRPALAESPWMATEKLGRGQVALFTQDPTFRCAWGAMEQYFLNALLVLPSRSR